MKNNESDLNNALEKVDPRRRGFLTTLLAGTAALPVMTTVALGEQPPSGGKGKGGKGKGGQGKGGQGKGGQGKGGQGKGQQGGQMDPARMAAKLIQEFDKDGDKALSVTELTAALKSMRERQGRGRRAGGAGKGKGKGAAGGETQVGGGVKPKKPGQ